MRVRFFTGWGGGCSGTGGCAVTMTADRTVAATFSQGITVGAPNGGEILRKNKTATIRWSYLGNPGATVKIELLKGGVLNKTISNEHLDRQRRHRFLQLEGAGFTGHGIELPDQGHQ